MSAEQSPNQRTVPWLAAFVLSLVLTAGSHITASAAGPLPAKITAAGDSITMGFAASCSCNTNFFCMLCLLGGDQPQNSWFDGSSSDVFSVYDRYKQLSTSIAANKSAAASGSEMRGGSNNFSVQTSNIVRQTPVPDHVEILLGGNDICNRDCVDPAHCADPVYTDAQWRSSVQAGLNNLMNGMPAGSTVRLLGVPRVQDLRAAGLQKQAASRYVNCENVWSDFGICRIATQGTTLNGESLSQRLAGISERQRRYNEILKEEAASYNTNANGRNTRGIEVLADYVDEQTPSIGTTAFSAADIDGGDCFHPSLRGQNTIANTSWSTNPDKP